MGEKNSADGPPTPAAATASSAVPPGQPGTAPAVTASPPLPPFVPVAPKAIPMCPIEHILYGPAVAPEQRIKGYSEDEFENFIREWAFFYKQLKEKKYTQVGRFGGAGDMGR